MKTRHLLGVLAWLVCWPAMAAEPQISILTDPVLAPPAAHGLSNLTGALRAWNIATEPAASPDAARGKLLLIAGVAASNGPVATLLKSENLAVSSGPEALLIRQTRWQGKPALLVAGSDARGLMYALLDVAERVGWATDRNQPFSEISNTMEKPATPERALSLYTMHRAYWESRFYDENYWARYLDTLARNRFNSFVIIFGYENGGFLAPPYPYFFNVEAFPDVRMEGLSAAEQQRNLAALNRLIAMAHARGINITLGIWDHIYRGGVQGGGIANADDALKRPTPGLVWGVTTTNLTAYTVAGLTKLLKLVPAVDAIQFRMHDESGLKNQEQAAFWKSIFQVMKEKAPLVRFDARAKGLPDAVIETGLDLGVHLRITTKYWMEQMGLPFHPTHINRQNQFDRRHSYADLLRYPQRYPMHWRLWNGGTSRVLLWGDPEFARRFVESTQLYGPGGFEVNEPLATKMEAQPHDQKPFDLLNPPYRYYDYEFERYWHFFQVFGRLGYNPDTPAEVWQREFQKRLGAAAAPHVEKGLHLASQVLPRIVASVYPYGGFPMTRGWAERQRLGDLPAYAKNEGSDIQQFASFDEEAKMILEDGESAKIRPSENSRWFADLAQTINREVVAAENKGAGRMNKEFQSTLVDLKILSGLAQFHAQRIPAAVNYCLYQRTKDLNALVNARNREQLAVSAWRQLVADATNVYTEDLAMGVRSANLCGHWKDELAALEKGLAALLKQEADYQPVVPEKRPFIGHVPIRQLGSEDNFTVGATISDRQTDPKARLRFRFGTEEYKTADLAARDRFRFRGESIRIPPGTQKIEYYLEVSNEAGQQVTWPADGKPITVAVSADREPPNVKHQPVLTARANQPLAIAAEITDPSGVKWARLRYRSVNQQLDFEILPMTSEGGNRYEATVPAEQMNPKFDFMYFIEVMDNQGNGRISPDLNVQTPYVVVKLLRP